MKRCERSRKKGERDPICLCNGRPTALGYEEAS